MGKRVTNWYALRHSKRQGCSPTGGPARKSPCTVPLEVGGAARWGVQPWGRTSWLEIRIRCRARGKALEAGFMPGCLTHSDQLSWAGLGLTSVAGGFCRARREHRQQARPCRTSLGDPCTAPPSMSPDTSLQELRTGVVLHVGVGSALGWSSGPDQSGLRGYCIRNSQGATGMGRPR